MKNVSDKLVEGIKTYFIFNNICLNSCSLWDNVENIAKPDRPQITIKYGACALHAGYLRLRTQV
jgi:hypothetical protein